MKRLLSSLSTSVVLAATAGAQCLQPATGTTVLPLTEWSSTTGFGTAFETDDALTLTPIPLAFAFPMAGAVGTLDQLWVDSNGGVYLTDSTLGLTNVVNGAGLGISSLSELRGTLAGASARIAIMGDDLNASQVVGAVGDILVDQTVPGECRIVYKDWSRFANTTDQHNFSCTLYSSGAIRFDYDLAIGADLDDTRYVGVSIGNLVGTTSSPSRDLTAGADSGTEGLLYEAFGTSNLLDIAGKSLLLSPNGMGGYVSTVLCEPATHTNYGSGCYNYPRSFAQLFGDQATTKTALDGNRMRLTPTAIGYLATWIPGGATSYIAPGGGAVTLTFPIANGAVTFAPSVAFPIPGGTTASVTVSENGIVTAAALPNNASDTTPALADLSSSAAPAIAFYSFRDFTLSEAGSGPIQREEVVVGPDTILCITWNAVEALPAGANPTTFQFQLNLNTGVVDYVWVSWDPGTSTSDTLVGAKIAGGGTTPTSTTLATGLPLGIVNAGESSVYQFFADQTTAKAALDGNAIDFTPSGSGYLATWVAGGGASFIAPSGGATTHTFGASNGNVQITPSSPMPVPGGSVATVSVSENGILTMAATANNGTDTTPAGADMVGTAAPSLGFYAWRNFDLAEAGSGPIQSEEVVVGPHTVLCITWSGVEATPAGANPTTFQFQCNLNTGTVRLAVVTWDGGGSADDVLVGATLAGTDFDPFTVALSTALPKSIQPPKGALAMSASPAPVFTIGGSTVPMTWQIDNLVDLSVLPGVYIAFLGFSFLPIPAPGIDLTLVGVDAPGCAVLIGGLDIIIPISPTASSHAQPLTIPQPLSPGLTFYSQCFNLIIPNSLPNGLNGFGLITSNAIATRCDLQ